MRELRQHASRYLARVRAGETIEVTDRGRPVARLVPVDETWEDLIASGFVNPPEDPDFDIATIEPIDIPPGAIPASELLQQDREERL